MNVDVAVNGRPWKVAIERPDHPATVTVVIKGRARVVNAVWIDRDTLSLIDRGAVHDVRIHRRMNGAVRIAVDSGVFEALVTSAKRSRSSTDVLSGSRAIRAPMPGRVVRVLVAVGDRVSPRQAVVVVEAMKMENELRVSAAGTVTEVRAVEGATVEAGTILVVIEN